MAGYRGALIKAGAAAVGLAALFAALLILFEITAAVLGFALAIALLGIAAGVGLRKKGKSA